MLHMEDVTEKCMKEVFIVQCYSMLDGASWSGGKYEGDYVSDYKHGDHYYPVLYQNWHCDDDRKKFAARKDCEEFIELSMNLVESDIWDYRVGTMMVDKYLEVESYTGVYNKKTNFLTICSFGEHYNAIRYQIWKHIFENDLLTDEEIRTKFMEKSEYPLYNNLEPHFVDFLQKEKKMNGYRSEMTVELLREYVLEYGKDDENTYSDNVDVPYIPLYLHELSDAFIEDELILRSEYMVGGQNEMAYK